MKKIEDKIIDNFFELANLALSKLIKPNIELKDITELTSEKIDEINRIYGIEGIILDIDETLRKDMQQIPKCNQEWINMAKQRIKIIVLSNGIDKSIEEYFKTKGIKYIGFAHKPIKKNFIKACKDLNLKPEQVLVIGDQTIEDVYGGKRNNMKTARVKSVLDEER